MAVNGDLNGRPVFFFVVIMQTYNRSVLGRDVKRHPNCVRLVPLSPRFVPFGPI